MAVATRAIQRTSLTAWSNPAELVRIIVILSLPVAATNALQFMLGFVDTRMVSPIGAPALAAMGVARPSMMLMMSVFMGLGVGITAHVARHTGAGEHDTARSYATIGVVSGGVIGLLLMSIGLLVGPTPFHIMATSQGGGVDAAASLATQQYAWDFMRILFISLGGVGMQAASVSVFNSLGRTTYPMWLLVMNNVLNFAGNIILIPRYHVAGCAASTALTTLMAAIVAVTVLTREGVLRWDALHLAAPLRRAWEMLRIGLPATAQMAFRNLSMLAIFKMITFLPNSIVGQGALQVGLQAEGLAFMPAFAFSIAAATLVGQNLGARRPEQARQAALYCVIGSQIVMWGIGSLLFFFPEYFVGLCIGNSTPEVIAPAANFLRILALCLPGLGAGMTFMGVLRGAGDTAITAGISFTAMWAIRIPLAALLAFSMLGNTTFGYGLGLSGIWWAMTISVYIETALAYARFASGKWAKVKLAED